MKRLLITLSMLAGCGFMKSEVVSVNGLKVDIVSHEGCRVLGVDTDLEYVPEELTIPEYIELDGEEYVVNSIQEGAFQENDRIMRLNIEAPITMVPAYLCSGMVNLQTVFLPASVIKIQEGAFSLCHNLIEIESLHENSLPVLETIGDKAFYQCYSLEQIPETPTLRIIGESAMMNCSAMMDFCFPETLRKIDNNAFCGCESLKEAAIPENLLTLGTGVFDGCSSLEKVNFDKSINILPSYSFRNCSSLQDFNWTKILKEIGESCFENCRELKNLNIERGVETLGRYCFAGCSKIKRLELSLSAKLIPEGAFNGCASLEFVSIGGEIEEIGERAFYNCSQLATIELCHSVGYLRREVFGDCPVLIYIYCDRTFPPVIDDTTFPDHTYADGDLYVPQGVENVYDQTPVWNRFLTIRGVTDFPTHSGMIEIADRGCRIDYSLEGDSFRLNSGVSSPIRFLDINGVEIGCLKGFAGESIKLGATKVAIVRSGSESIKILIP